VRFTVFHMMAAGDRRQEIYRAWWLWLSLLMLFLVLACVMWGLSKRRRMLATRGRQSDPKPIKNAWEEAGRRAEPIPEDDANPDEPGEEEP
jgi:hypothetical protein